jgi:GNAT superfamily N-acetyltransferase
MDDNVLVREATAADADAMARLCTQLGYAASGNVMPARLARLSADPNARALVAVYGDAVVGLVTAHLRNTLNHEAPIAQITLLVVDEAVQTRGAGSALVHAAEEWARSRGARRVAVTTALARSGAHAFYEKVGYAHTGRRYGKDFPISDHERGGRDA